MRNPKIDELYDIVTNECYCIWSLFMENVSNEGWTTDRLLAEIGKCKDREALRRLVNKFI